MIAVLAHMLVDTVERASDRLVVLAAGAHRRVTSATSIARQAFTFLEGWDVGDVLEHQTPSAPGSASAPPSVAAEPGAGREVECCLHLGGSPRFCPCKACGEAVIAEARRANDRACASRGC